MAGCLLVLALNARHAGDLFTDMSEGARNAVLPIFNTASEVGFGATIASLAAFTAIRDGIFGISDNAVVTSAVSSAAISGVTGLASGGMTIAVDAFGEQLTASAQAQGIDLEVMHRATGMASVSWDALPHNGAIITLLLVTGLTHRESYKDGSAARIGDSGQLDLGEIVDADDRARNLKENALPAGLAQVDATNYPEFLEHRRVLMAQIMRRYYEAL